MNEKQKLKVREYDYYGYRFTIREKLGKNGKSVFRTRIANGERNSDGSLKYKDFTGRSMSVVERKAKEFVDQLVVIKERRKKGLSDIEKTVKELAEEYLENRSSGVKPLSQNTLVLYKSLLKVHIIPELGNLPLSEVDYDVLQTFIDKKADRAKQTIKDLKCILNRMFEFAIRKKYATQNPTTLLEVGDKKSKQREALSEQQEKVLLKAIEMLPRRLDSHYGISRSQHFKETFGTALLVALNCGLRRGELFGLPVDAVDTEKGEIDIRQQLIFPNNSIGVLSPNLKTDSGNRKIPIPTEISDIIKKHKEKAIACGHKLMFCKADGMPYSHSDIKRRTETINNLCREIALNEPQPFEFGKFTIHQLRHTYCTRLTELGLDPFEIQYFMGHSKARVTAEVYTTLRNNRTQAAAKKIRALSYTEKGGECDD